MVRILVKPGRQKLLPQVRLKLAATVGGDGHWHTEVSNPAGKEGIYHGCCRVMTINGRGWAVCRASPRSGSKTPGR